MIRHSKKQFRIYGIYDTETCNIGEGNNTRAYPILFIYNDVHNIDISKYIFDKTDNIMFYRHGNEFINHVNNVIKLAKSKEEIPIICAYNLMFDLQPILYELNKQYAIKVNGQTASNCYTVDLMENDEIILRFWDVFYLEMNGLRAMGETCGVPKATGDWDYTLKRTPETSLTELEYHYARRDVQVIPAYLAYLCVSNDWLKAEMLGCRVLTKTSIVRQFAKKKIGVLRYDKNNKNGYLTLSESMYRLCKQEFSQSYNQYALRKACFRGGLTFTSAKCANKVYENVASLDVTSMHHAFINGRQIPVHFKLMQNNILQHICNDIVKTSLDTVLENYDKPFAYGIHALVCFTNIRLKKNSVFGKYGIGIIPESKFAARVGVTDTAADIRAKYAEETIREHGFKDYARKPMFAFSKLMSAQYCELFVNEMELWNIAHVYDFSEMIVKYGEASVKFIVPPDYVTLQSNVLFEQKNEMKKIVNNYIEGEKYTLAIGETIPAHIADEVRNGTAELKFLNAYYNSTIKGMFNGIYGTQAMDLVKPTFRCENGNIEVDHSTIATPENYNDKKPKRPMVLYTYGMRIVAGSRMHLIIAMMLLYDKLGNKFIPTGGDTDSIKCALGYDITDNTILNILKPLHHSVAHAITKTMERVRKLYPQLASQLTNIGVFDIEKCGNSKRYVLHMEAWNKARISMDTDHKYHITCAGLSRPRGMYTIEDFCTDMQNNGHDFNEIAHAIFGYDTFVDNSISHSLERYKPKTFEKYNDYVTDYQGNINYVNEYQSIALYPSGRWLGELTKRSPLENAKYLRAQGMSVNTADKTITRIDDKIYVFGMNEIGDNVPLMIGEIRK